MHKNLFFASSEAGTSISTKVADVGTMQTTALSSFLIAKRTCVAPTSPAANIAMTTAGESSRVPSPVLLKKQHHLMTPAEAAAYLGVQEATLATWRSTRRYNLPYVKIGRKIFYTQAALDKFIASRTVSLDA